MYPLHIGTISQTILVTFEGIMPLLVGLDWTGVTKLTVTMVSSGQFATSVVRQQGGEAGGGGK